MVSYFMTEGVCLYEKEGGEHRQFEFKPNTQDSWLNLSLELDSFVEIILEKKYILIWELFYTSFHFTILKAKRSL